MILKSCFTWWRWTRCKTSKNVALRSGQGVAGFILLTLAADDCYEESSDMMQALIRVWLRESHSLPALSPRPWSPTSTLTLLLWFFHTDAGLRLHPYGGTKEWGSTLLRLIMVPSVNKASSKKIYQRTVNQLEEIPSQGVNCPGKITCVILGHVKRPVSWLDTPDHCFGRLLRRIALERSQARSRG